MDIVRFIEPCLELHDHRDVFAGDGRAAQRVPNRRRSARPIQRQLDRTHLGILGRFRDKPLKAVGKRVVRVIHEDIVRVDLLCHRAVRRERRGRRKRRIVRKRSRGGDVAQPAEIHDAVRDVDVGGVQGAFALALLEAQLPLEQVLERRRRTRLELDPQDRPRLPPDELLFDRLQEVGGHRLVQLEVAAAGEPKCMRAGNEPTGVE